MQNEPEFAAPWDACLWTVDATRDFLVRHLGPRLRREHPELKVPTLPPSNALAIPRVVA